jgi:hypothetical protein
MFVGTVSFGMMHVEDKGNELSAGDLNEINKLVKERSVVIIAYDIWDLEYIASKIGLRFYGPPKIKKES